MSALRSSSSASIEPSLRAIPIDAVTLSSRSSIVNGSLSASRIRSAISRASCGAVDAVEKHRELVATEPRRRVGRAHERIDARRDPLQQKVTGAVPEAVVDRLEVIEVEEQHRQRAAASEAPAASAWRRRFSNSARLARPVSESWNAWWRSSSSNALRSLMSRMLSTRPLDRGIRQTGSRRRSRRSTQRPSAWRSRVRSVAGAPPSSLRPQEALEQRLVVRVHDRGDRRLDQRAGLEPEQAAHRCGLPAHAQVATRAR